MRYELGQEPFIRTSACIDDQCYGVAFVLSLCLELDHGYSSDQCQSLAVCQKPIHVNRNIASCANTTKHCACLLSKEKDERRGFIFCYC